MGQYSKSINIFLQARKYFFLMLFPSIADDENQQILLQLVVLYK